MKQLILENSYLKCIKKAKKQGKDLSKLRIVIEMLIKGEKLPLKYKDHKLIGRFTGYRECHIEPDWLLVYQQYDDKIILKLLGSHSELFR